MVRFDIDITKPENNDIVAEWSDEIMMLSEQYVMDTFQGDEQRAHDQFNRLLLHLHSTYIKRSDCNDVSAIPIYKYLFSIYTALCIRYSVLPSYGIFCLFAGIDIIAFDRWLKGEGDNSAVTFAANISNYCRSMTIDRLHNMRGSDANLIFISKAAYGLTETAPVKVIEHRRQDSIDTIFSSLGIETNDTDI